MPKLLSRSPSIFGPCHFPVVPPLALSAHYSSQTPRLCQPPWACFGCPLHQVCLPTQQIPLAFLGSAEASLPPCSPPALLLPLLHAPCTQVFAPVPTTPARTVWVHGISLPRRLQAPCMTGCTHGITLAPKVHTTQLPILHVQPSFCHFGLFCLTT